MSSSRRIPALSLHHYSLSSAPPAPRAAAACWFFYSLWEEWEGRGGGRAGAAPRWDLGPRGDYPQGWSCVCAVPASPGPFRHGLTPGSQRTPGKASYLPRAPARPRSDCHLRRHPIPSCSSRGQGSCWAFPRCSPPATAAPCGKSSLQHHTSEMDLGAGSPKRASFKRHSMKSDALIRVVAFLRQAQDTRTHLPGSTVLLLLLFPVFSLKTSQGNRKIWEQPLDSHGYPANSYHHQFPLMAQHEGQGAIPAVLGSPHCLSSSIRYSFIQGKQGNASDLFLQGDTSSSQAPRAP